MTRIPRQSEKVTCRDDYTKRTAFLREVFKLDLELDTTLHSLCGNGPLHVAFNINGAERLVRELRRIDGTLGVILNGNGISKLLLKAGSQ